MYTIPNPHRECEQCQQREAQCYAVDPIPNGWGGHYCHDCAKALNFKTIDQYKN